MRSSPLRGLFETLMRRVCARRQVNNTLLKVRIKIVFDWDIAPQTTEGALKASEAVLAYLDEQARGFSMGFPFIPPEVTP